MNLLHIKTAVCPTCGARPVAEEQKNQHCSGEWNETRRFACGMVVKYSPNFRAQDTTTECPKEPVRMLLLEKRKQAKAAAIAFIGTLDCDTKFKERLANDIEYITYDW